MAASSPKSAGTPMNCRRGSGRTSPRVQIPADVVPGSTRPADRPTAPIRSVPSGRLASSASAPALTGMPATSDTVSLPPSRGDPSSTVTSRPRSASRNAAASPAIPPPTTATRRRALRGAVITGSRTRVADQSRNPIIAPGAEPAVRRPRPSSMTSITSCPRRRTRGGACSPAACAQRVQHWCPRRRGLRRDGPRPPAAAPAQQQLSNEAANGAAVGSAEARPLPRPRG